MPEPIPSIELRVEDVQTPDLSSFDIDPALDTQLPDRDPQEIYEERMQALKDALKEARQQEVTIKKISFAEEIERADGSRNVIWNGKEIRSDGFDGESHAQMQQRGFMAYAEFNSGSVLQGIEINQNGDRITRYTLIEFEDARVAADAIDIDAPAPVFEISEHAASEEVTEPSIEKPNAKPLPQQEKPWFIEYLFSEQNNTERSKSNSLDVSGELRLDAALDFESEVSAIDPNEQDLTQADELLNPITILVTKTDVSIASTKESPFFQAEKNHATSFSQERTVITTAPAVGVQKIEANDNLVVEIQTAQAELSRRDQNIPTREVTSDFSYQETKIAQPDISATEVVSSNQRETIRVNETGVGASPEAPVEAAIYQDNEGVTTPQKEAIQAPAETIEVSETANQTESAVEKPNPITREAPPISVSEVMRLPLVERSVIAAPEPAREVIVGAEPSARELPLVEFLPHDTTFIEHINSLVQSSEPHAEVVLVGEVTPAGEVLDATMLTKEGGVISYEFRAAPDAQALSEPAAREVFAAYEWVAEAVEGSTKAASAPLEISIGAAEEQLIESREEDTTFAEEVGSPLRGYSREATPIIRLETERSRPRPQPLPPVSEEDESGQAAAAPLPQNYLRRAA